MLKLHQEWYIFPSLLLIRLLIEIWLFTNECQNRVWNSAGIKSVNKLFITFHWHSQLYLKWKSKTNYNLQEINSKTSKISKNKNRPIIVSFAGLHYQSFVTQATATIPAFLVIFIRLKSMVKSSVQLNSVVWEFFWDLSINGLTKLVISIFPFPF